MNFDLKFYFQLALRRLPVMAVIFSLCAGLGVALALTMPPRYTADAKLLVESAQISTEKPVRGAEDEASKQLQVIKTRLLTRANLVDVANKFKVFEGEGNLSPDEVVDMMRDQTYIGIEAGRKSATFMEIAFTSHSAKVSADVVNEFVTLVLAEDTDIRSTGSRQKLEFYVQQVQRLDEELARQSAEIVAYKEANKDALPESLQYRLDRRATLQERLNLSIRDRASLNDQRDRLVAIGVQNSAQPVALTAEEQLLRQYKAELVEWEVVLGGNTNPKVEVLKAKISQLEMRIEQMGEAGTGDTTSSVLDLQLAEIDSRIAFIEEEMERGEAELEELRIAIEATPSVANRLAQLEREYTNTQTLYNRAVADRALAEQGDQIEVNKKGERVTVIEQAVAPSAPTSPNRKLIAGGGVFLGGGLAAFFFLLTELLNRSIRRPVDLTRALGVQPLATIPYMEEESVRRRRRALKTILLAAILIAIPVGLWAIHTFYLPLEIVLERILERVGL
ncbi:MAG: lipopolysaccharide biosynthesis [Silicimonas sp.]|nr:lipopolysaccharide biosynthesis [Silicimonas sp.]